jgi:predicted phosphodiesterase
VSFRLAVLSDLHIDRDAESESWDLAKAAFDAVAEEEPDHAVVVGDLFDSASAMLRDRERVERRLRRIGLWNRDRLSIVIGNHDIFHTPHRGSRWHRAQEFLRVRGGDAQQSYLAFTEWAGQLVPRSARYWSNDPFPFCKDLGVVGLLGADTTGQDTAHSVNGYWREEEDAASRELASGDRRVLALHHPPEPDDERTLFGQLTDGYAFGFAQRHFGRLEEFVDGAHIDAVVCGHIHVGGERSWRIGGRTRVFRAGETGGLHGTKPSFLVLEITRRGAVRCRRVRF